MAGQSDSTLWLLLPRPIRRLPSDIAAIFVLVCLAALVTTAPILRDTPLRVVFTLPLVLFLPGYALVAVLFPRRGTGSDGVASDDARTVGRGGISAIERIGLSYGVSIAVVALLGMALHFTPWGIQLIPILLVLGGFTVVSGVLATLRRWRVPADERLSVPYRRWFRSLYTGLFAPETRRDTVLNAVFVCSLLFALGSVGYAATSPGHGAPSTEFYLLTENPDGELVATGYPDNVTTGDPVPLVVGVTNHEKRQVSYTVVVALQQVEIRDNETNVRSSNELRRFSPTVADNESWQRSHEITPRSTGTNLRLTYLLYEGEVPSERTLDSAYRSNYLWINVTNG